MRYDHATDEKQRIRKLVATRFADPDKLDIARRDNVHLSFAAGPHRCIGEVLAKVEGRIAFETILRRMPKLTLADRNPKWRPAMSLRGL
ncbi:MAG: cytochrome P450 [Candidatus Binatus sp.]|uniref:cytochrome P450 n=1 Tax=Candidatus Binatus sp. TaxID=2811406 RepID=UPI003C7126F0